MAIKKQEFYEGAALHILAQTGQLKSLSYVAPLFTVNGCLRVLLKYSTKNRSPWGFTFQRYEQSMLDDSRGNIPTMIGLVCGSDGVVALSCDQFIAIANPRPSAIHIACYRSHGEHYEIFGPDGPLSRKISPSNWAKILEDKGHK